MNISAPTEVHAWPSREEGHSPLEYSFIHVLLAGGRRRERWVKGRKKVGKEERKGERSDRRIEGQERRKERGGERRRKEGRRKEAGREMKEG